MDIVLVLLATSVLAGAAVGFRLKALALVPIALLIAVFSAAILHMNGFGPGSGIATIVACLVSNQAAYVLVQILGPGLASDRSLDNVLDGEPHPARRGTMRQTAGLAFARHLLLNSR